MKTIHYISTNQGTRPFHLTPHGRSVQSGILRVEAPRNIRPDSEINPVPTGFFPHHFVTYNCLVPENIEIPYCKIISKSLKKQDTKDRLNNNKTTEQ